MLARRSVSVSRRNLEAGQNAVKLLICHAQPGCAVCVDVPGFMLVEFK